MLEDEGIPVDFICGSSMGAVVGAVYCCGTDLRIAGQIIPKLNEKDLFDFRIPRKGGFIKGEKFQALVKLLTKNKSFDETLIPFTCVAVDLYTGKLVVLSEGSSTKAPGGAMLFPGVRAVSFEWNAADGRRRDLPGALRCGAPNGGPSRRGVDVGYRATRTENTPSHEPEF